MRGSVSASALPLLLALRRLSRRALCAAKAITDGGAHCCGWRSMARREVVGGGKFSHQCGLGAIESSSGADMSVKSSQVYDARRGRVCWRLRLRQAPRSMGNSLSAISVDSPFHRLASGAPWSTFDLGPCLGCLLFLYTLYWFDLTSLAERTSGGRWIDWTTLYAAHTHQCRRDRDGGASTRDILTHDRQRVQPTDRARPVQ